MLDLYFAHVPQIDVVRVLAQSQSGMVSPFAHRRGVGVAGSTHCAASDRQKMSLEVIRCL